MRKKYFLLCALIVTTNSLLTEAEDINPSGSWSNNTSIIFDNTPGSESNVIVKESDTTVTNTANGTISVSYTEENIDAVDRVEKGNGINIEENLSNVSVINNGTIKGTVNLTGNGSVNSSGNGISLYDEANGDNNIKALQNKGLISGTANVTAETTAVKIKGNESGNGVALFGNNSNSIGKLDNRGTISGAAILTGTSGTESANVTAGKSGNGLMFLSLTDTAGVTNSVGDLDNKGTISGTATLKGTSTGGAGSYLEALGSGNGIFMQGYSASNNIGTLTNSGAIQGTVTAESANGPANLTTSGNGIFLNSRKANSVGTLTNSGTIKGTATGISNRSGTPLVNPSGNGVFLAGSGANNITTLKNVGKIEGSAVVSTLVGTRVEAIGNGVSLYGGSTNSVGTLTNNGAIQGTATVTGTNSVYKTGNGVSLYGGVTSIGTLNNAGKIEGAATATGGGNTFIVGNGVSLYSYGSNNSNNIGTLENTGLIKGTAVLTGTNNITGNGVSLYSSEPNNSNSIGILNNAGIILGTATLSKAGSLIGEANGNGVLLHSGSNSIGTLNNAGIILGTLTAAGTNTGSGNGALLYGLNNSIGTLNNRGLIEGIATITETSNGSGNGNGVSLSGTTTSIGTLENNGVIKGVADIKGTVIATGTTSAVVNASGNGVSLYSSYKGSTNNIGALNNIGLIEGSVVIEATVTTNAAANGSGISLYGGTNTIGTLRNDGRIKGKANIIKGGRIQEVGNGIGLYSDGGTNTIEMLENLDRIEGSVNLVEAGISNGTGSGVALVSEGNSKNTIGTLKNTGRIEGSATVSGWNGATGSGINLYGKDNSVGKLENLGKIEGTANITRGMTVASGNGVSLYGGTTNSIGTLKNTGVIEGVATTEGMTVASGNGISLDGNTNTITKLENLGKIEGSASMTTTETKTISGNGVSLYSTTSQSPTNSIGTLENKGTMSGYASTNTATLSGNGLLVNSQIGTDSKVSNWGVIKGSQNAILATGIAGTVNNYGVLAGQNIYGNGQGAAITPAAKNQGVYITLGSALDSNGNPVIAGIINGTAGTSADGKTIVNAAKNSTGIDSSITVSNKSYKNSIINGAGIAQGTLVVQKNSTIEDSIVNAYNTAVYLDNNAQLTATNVTFNGGGLKGDTPVIKGSDGDSEAMILGNSLINGNVDMGGGNDSLAIAKTVQINGTLNGGAGIDSLKLGDSLEDLISGMDIHNDITGFEYIETNAKVTLHGGVKVKEAEKINLVKGDLILRVDPSKKDDDGNVIGHSFHENIGDIYSTGGALQFALNGIGENMTIAMGGTSIDQGMDDDWWKESDKLKTDSLVLAATLTSAQEPKAETLALAESAPSTGDIVNITVKEDIPLIPMDPSNPLEPSDPNSPTVIDPELYGKLNQVYKSIVSAGEIGELANTTLLTDKTYDESLDGLLIALDQIYANNPYAYTLKSTRDSLKLFEDNMSYLTIKPKKDEVIVQGKAIYTGVKSDSSSSGKDYYGVYTGHRNYKTTTNTGGGLATVEYGVTENTSVGLVLGGNHQDVNFKGSSDIKGNSLYLGAFAKTDINSFRLMGGLGYQYTSADADRNVSNGYNTFSTGDTYDINSLNIFAEVKYIYTVNDDWSLEPKARLSYYYVDQDGTNEGYTPGQLSLAADSASSSTGDIEIGIDFVRSAYLENGTLKNILSLGVINTLGDRTKDLTGYIVGNERNGSTFGIQGVKLPKVSGKAGYNIEFEQKNGMIYTAGVSLEFGEDDNKNFNAVLGLGYKF